VHIPDTADIREGDLLVSSGLGGRFPRGYPVAKVVSVQRDPGEPFALVKAEPSAMLNKSRHILLVDMPPQADVLPVIPEPVHGEKIKPKPEELESPESVGE